MRGQSKKAGGEGGKGWVGGEGEISRRPNVLVHTKHLEGARKCQTTLSALKEGSLRQGREDGKPLRKRVKFNDGKGESSHGVRGNEGGSMGGDGESKGAQGVRMGEIKQGLRDSPATRRRGEGEDEDDTRQDMETPSGPS